MRKTGWMSAAFVVAVSVLGFAGAASAQVEYSNRPPPPPPNQYQPGYPPYGGRTVSCGSPQHRFARCPLPGNWRSVRLVRQTSKAPCVQGRSWGYDRGSVWVDDGCAGLFAAGAYNGGWRPDPGWDHDFTMSCGSPQYRYAFCQVDVGARGRVVLQRQTSDARCVEGQTWGWNRAGVWVDRGCSALFLIVRRW